MSAAHTWRAEVYCELEVPAISAEGYSQSGRTSRAAAVPKMNHASIPLPCPLVALRYICGIQNEYSAKRKKGRTEGARMYWNAIQVRTAAIKTERQLMGTLDQGGCDASCKYRHEMMKRYVQDNRGELNNASLARANIDGLAGSGGLTGVEAGGMMPASRSPSAAGGGGGGGGCTRGGGGGIRSGACIRHSMTAYRYRSAHHYFSEEPWRRLRLTGPNTMAESKPKKPGTSSGRLALLSLTNPKTRCAENSHESMMHGMPMVNTDTFASAEGVRVSSICRTRRMMLARRAMVANVASVGQFDPLAALPSVDLGRAVDGL